MGRETRKKRWGAFKVGQDKKSSVQNNKYQGTVGPSSHDHDQNFGSDYGIKFTKGVLNYCSLGNPVCGRGVEEKINVKRTPLSQSKSLSRGKTFVVGHIDKELLGKEAAINKSERTTFAKARMRKVLEATLKVLQREDEGEERTGNFNMKAERTYIESNKAKTMELEAQMFEAESIDGNYQVINLFSPW